MKKALLIFCVIISVNVANGECPYACNDIDCASAMEKCAEENTLESLERAIKFCKKRYGEIRSYSGCRLFQIQKDALEQESLRQQAAQQKQARYAKCRNGNADACFDIGYEELSECQEQEEVSCNPSEALVYFSKACKLKHKVGCFNIAMILEQNQFFKNPQKAQEYYRKSCNMGYEPACFKVR